MLMKCDRILQNFKADYFLNCATCLQNSIFLQLIFVHPVNCQSVAYFMSVQWIVKCGMFTQWCN